MELMKVVTGKHGMQTIIMILRVMTCNIDMENLDGCSSHSVLKVMLVMQENHSDDLKCIILVMLHWLLADDKLV